MLTYFKPNKNNTGSLASISFNSKEGSLYIQIKRQTSWNSETNKGEFKGGAWAIVKLSVFEIGALINSICKVQAFSTVHAFPEGTTSIFFSPRQDDNKVLKGFVFSFIRNINGNKETFGIGFNAANGESQTLLEFLRFSLDHIFSAMYSKAKIEAEERKKKQKGKPLKETEPTTEKQPEEEDPF